MSSLLRAGGDPATAEREAVNGVPVDVFGKDDSRVSNKERAQRHFRSEAKLVYKQQGRASRQ